jgi:hypothetical protein
MSPDGLVSSKLSSLPAPWPWNSFTMEHFLRFLAFFPFPTTTCLHTLILALLWLPTTERWGEPRHDEAFLAAVLACLPPFFAPALPPLTGFAAFLGAAFLGAPLAWAAATSPKPSEPTGPDEINPAAIAATMSTRRRFMRTSGQGTRRYRQH